MPDTSRQGLAASGRADREAVAIALLAGAIHAPSLAIGFLSDDFDLLTSFAQAPLSQALAAFAQPFSGEFRPLYVLSFAFDHQLWGLDPAGYHLTNVVLHMVCAVLLLRLARRLGLPEPAPLLAAALFAVHGVAIGSVDWISGRVDVLATLFVLAGATAFLRYQQGGRGSALLMTVACQLFALLSKETGLVLAAWVLALAALAPRPRALWPAVPVLLAVLVHVAYWRWALGAPTHYAAPLDVHLEETWAGLLRLGAIAGFPLSGALWHSVAVDRLALVTVCALALAGFIGGERFTRWRLAALCAASLLPVLTLLRMPRDLYHSRHAYLPCAALLLLCALGLRSLAQRSAGGRLLLPAGVAAALMLGLALQLNIRLWGRSGALARDIADGIAAAVQASPARRFAVTGYRDMEDGMFLFHGDTVGEAVLLRHPELGERTLQCWGTYGCPFNGPRPSGVLLVRVRLDGWRVASVTLEP